MSLTWEGYCDSLRNGRSSWEDFCDGDSQRLPIEFRDRTLYFSVPCSASFWDLISMVRQCFGQSVERVTMLKKHEKAECYLVFHRSSDSETTMTRGPQLHYNGKPIVFKEYCSRQDRKNKQVWAEYLDYIDKD